jgi:hypothetical protein
MWRAIDELEEAQAASEGLFDMNLANARRGERRESLATVKRLVDARSKRKGMDDQGRVRPGGNQSNLREFGVRVAIVFSRT